MGRWAQARRRGTATPLPTLVWIFTDLEDAGSGALNLAWRISDIPDDVVLTLKKASDNSVVAIHTDHLPGAVDGNFTFSGLTIGVVMYVDCIATRVGFQQARQNSQTKPVPA